MKKSDGQIVREAYDGPKVEHDALIDHIEARAREQHARSSDASESAAKTAEFVESTALNSQALSWLSSIVKKLPKKDGQAKAMDIIRSLEVGLPMVKSHVGGQGTSEMDLGSPEPETNSETEVADAEPAPDLDAEIKDGDPELAAEAEAFDVNVDNVVTPIDFGAAQAAE